MIRLAHITAVVSAVFSVIMLKFLQFFNFLSWHPTTFLKVIEEPFFRYIVLGLIIYVIALVLFLVGTVLRHSSVAAFIIAVIIVIVVENVFMHEKVAWKHITIGFFVLTLLNCRFIMETAYFYKTRNIRKKVEEP